MTSAATATQERTTDYNPLLKAAVEYARRGFPIFPCKRADKKPLVRHGFKDATTDERQIREWWQKWPQAMIGMPTGGTSGIDVLDLDLKPDEYIDGSKLVPDWDQRSCVLVRTPSGGAHVWFKSTGKVRNSTDRIAPGVDTRGDGGYVIVPPSRNLTGDGYRFIKGGIEDIAQQLPPFSEDLLDKLGAKHEERPGTNPKSSPERIHAAMEAIPNPDLGWDDWKKFGMAIWRATSGSEAGFSIFDEWSRKSSKYDAENTQAAWQEITNSPPSRIGPGTIFYHAKEANRQTAMAGGATAVLQTSTPVASAREFVRQGYQNNEASGLIYYRGSFYEWGGSHYEECDDDHLRSKLYEFLDNALTPDGDPFNPTKQKVNNIIDALKAGVEQNSKHNTPFWLDDVGRDASNLIACRNGLLNIQTRELLPHNPLLFNLNCLPFDYNRNAPTFPKQWMRFLRQLWPNDDDDKLARFALQEMFGLMLTTDTRYQKIFMLVGPRRSGKGTIGRVLSAMIGRDNVANPTMASMTGEFGLWPLIDKQVAIISDARLGGRADANVVAERLLSISGEDGQTVNRKNKTFWFGQLFVRFLVLTNELPRIRDASGALASRFIVLVLQNSFYGQEDPELTDKLLAELPGILNWSLLGLDRLRQHGRFRMPKASLDAIRQLEDLASPVTAFLRDWCDVSDRNARTNVKTLYDAWRYWSELHGERAGPSNTFGRDLRAARPEIGTGGRGKQRYYTGVRLSDEGYEEYESARDERVRAHERR